MKSLFVFTGMLGLLATTLTGCAGDPNYHVKKILEWHGPTPPPPEVIVVIQEPAPKQCCGTPTPAPAPQPTPAPTPTPNPCPPVIPAKKYKEPIHTVKWGPLTLYRQNAFDPIGQDLFSLPGKPVTFESSFRTDWTGKVTKDYYRDSTRSYTVDEWGKIVPLQDQTSVRYHEEPATEWRYVSGYPNTSITTAPNFSTTVTSGGSATTAPYSGRYGPTTPYKQ